MKYLDLYEKWISTGKIEDDPNNEIGSGGLCRTVIGEEAILEYFEEGSNSLACYWGYNGGEYTPNMSIDQLAYEFTPLRQNIVLLLAAINGEL